MILTVYDVKEAPPALFTDQMLSTDHKPMPREAWMLEQLKGKQFLRLIEAGRKQVGDRELAWFTQEYFYPSTLAEMVGGCIASEWRIVQVMEMLVKGMQELAMVSEGGHFNLCPQTVLMIGDERSGPIIRITGLDHAGHCCNGKPWFDTHTLNPCCCPPESFLGLFDSSADVYALGMVMAFMFMNRYPYPINEGMSPAQIQELVKKNAPDLTGVPEKFRPLILKAIQRRAV